MTRSSFTRRRFLRSVSGVGLPLVGGRQADRRAASGDATAGGAWRQRGRTAANTGATLDASVPSPSFGQQVGVEWTADVGTVRGRGAVVGDTVYVGSLDRRVYALDAATGATDWRFSTGESVRGAPAVADDSVYVGSDDGRVYALDAATGDQLWHFDAGAPVRSSPAVAGGNVYVSSADGRVYALAAESGHQWWHYRTGEGVPSAPVVADGGVYVVDDRSSRLYALDAEYGTERWTAGPGWHPPAVADGAVYAGRYDGGTVALDAATGDQRWVADVGAVGPYPPTASDGGVVTVTGTGRVLALDADDGTVRWGADAGRGATSPPVHTGAAVVVREGERAVRALAAGTGETTWHVPLGTRVTSLVATAGTLYVGGEGPGGGLSALGPVSSVTGRLRLPVLGPTPVRAWQAAAGVGGILAGGWSLRRWRSAGEDGPAPPGSASGPGPRAQDVTGYADADGETSPPDGGATPRPGGADDGAHRDRRQGVDASATAGTEGAAGDSDGPGPSDGSSTPPADDEDSERVTPDARVDRPDDRGPGPGSDGAGRRGGSDPEAAAAALAAGADPIEEATPVDADGPVHVYAAALADGDRGEGRVLALAPDCSANEAACEAFERSAGRWQRISHNRHVGAVFNVGAEPRPWLAFDAGTRPLADVDPETLDRDARLSAVGAVAEALRTGDLYNITHGSLDPGRVYLHDDGPAATVGGWGLTRAVRAALGRQAVTPYAAPEQVGDPGAATGATDVYRLGAVTHYLLTGGPPDDPARSDDSSLAAAAADSSRVRTAAVSDRVATVLSGAMATEPRDRYDSPAAFRDALGRALD